MICLSLNSTSKNWFRFPSNLFLHFLFSIHLSLIHGPHTLNKSCHAGSVPAPLFIGSVAGENIFARLYGKKPHTEIAFSEKKL